MKIGQLLSKGYEVLKACEIESYMVDCQLLLGKVLNLDKLAIILNRDKEIDESRSKEYFDLVELRKRKMPIKYILEECEFMGISFFIKEGVLIPRPDTEILVEEVIKDIKKYKFTEICDVCTGSGVIGLSIGKFLDNTIVDCLDVSDKAKEVTEENISRLNLEKRVSFIESDLLCDAIKHKKKYNVVVSNPPYISTDVIPTLMEDVKDYEPYIALWGGEDGLDFYRRITEESLKVLTKGGLLAYEIGYDQGEQVKEILKEKGFKEVKCIKDLAGMDRVVKGILE